MEIKNYNKKWLCQFMNNLELQDFELSFDKILILIEDEGYIIKPAEIFKRKKIKTFLHFRNVHRSPHEKFIVINPNIQEYLQGENINFIWGILHEIGHILTVGVRQGDSEMREVIAWDMAQHLIKCKLNQLQSKFDSFEKRSIFCLQEYWNNPMCNWNHQYQWITDQQWGRILKRISNQ